jgi:ABC-type antimicrobial peptide transport system permease subunit
MNIQNCYEQGKDSKTGFIINENRVQDHYLETLGMKIVEGRNFDTQVSSDSASYIINEAAAKKLGFSNPIGKKIYVWDNLGTIIGMVSDFHFSSMHKPVEPLVITRYENWYNMVVVRHAEGETTAVVEFLEKSFKEIDPNYTFTPVFPDQKFDSMYQKEERLNDLITAGSILAIIVSVMGLFALSAFTVRRRIKELGIRKTMGATVNQLLLLLSGKILIWLIPGILVAFPLAWMVIQSWLGDFAYHIHLVDYWWVWVLSAVIALVVGFMAVFYQSLKAARINPIECLKHD